MKLKYKKSSKKSQKKYIAPYLGFRNKGQNVIYLKAWVLPLIIRNFHRGLYVVMFPKSFDTIWIDLFLKIFASRGRQTGSPQHFQFHPAVFISGSSSAHVCRIWPPPCPSGGGGCGPVPLPSPTLPPALVSYPLLAASPHSCSRSSSGRRSPLPAPRASTVGLKNEVASSCISPGRRHATENSTQRSRKLPSFCSKTHRVLQSHRITPYSIMHYNVLL